MQKSAYITQTRTVATAIPLILSVDACPGLMATLLHTGRTKVNAEAKDIKQTVVIAVA